MFPIELGIVVPVFGRLEVFEHDGADFGSDCCQTTAQILVGFVVSGNIEWRGVPVKQIVEVGMEIGHAIDYQAGKLHGCSFNSDFSIVKKSKVSS